MPKASQIKTNDYIFSFGEDDLIRWALDET